MLRARAIIVLLIALLLIGASPALAGPIQFGKIQYDPPGVDTRTNAQLNAEYVTLRNTGTRRVNLYGWTVRDVAGHVYRFGGTLYLRPGYTVRIHTGKGTNTATHRYWRRSWYVWNNTGDTARLRNRAGTLMDRCRWGDGIGYTYCR